MHSSPSRTAITFKAYRYFVEKFKYITALFQIENSRFAYFQAVLRYSFLRQIRFPATTIRLHGAAFAARENSMDIAHLSSWFEPETTRFLLQLAPCRLVDIGAHVGRYPVILARQGCEVVCFEPFNENYRQLLANIALNGLGSQIIAWNLGCSDVSGIGDLFYSSGNEGKPSFIRKDGATVAEIHEVKRLDEICSSMKSIDVIKIDVEGLELKVLQGALEILQHKQPRLIVEIWTDEEERIITHFLAQQGYAVEAVLDGRNFVFGKPSAGGKLLMSADNPAPRWSFGREAKILG